MKLFDDTPFKHKHYDKTCRSCKFRERHQMGLSIIQYCGITPSNRTENGLFKIKAKDRACPKYEELESKLTYKSKYKNYENSRTQNR
ncbi:hypothetical protein WAF17_16580 [Bernardetia sp. ABR2-2B]|uniref:hypothetical protein n=1 Tax=Bernardetia sp. ABR2-2B TaxID=3127472 RepID=UPI0030D20C33